LEGISPDGEGGAIGQVGEGAADGARSGVTDRGENCARGESLVRDGSEVELCAAIDRYSIRDHLVRLNSPGIQPVGIGAIGLKSQLALHGKGDWPACAFARVEDRARAAPSPNRNRARNSAATAQGSTAYANRSSTRPGTGSIVNFEGATRHRGAAGVSISATKSQCPGAHLGDRTEGLNHAGEVGV